MKQLKNTPLKSTIYDLGFIAAYITAQIYHYFEYFKNQISEYLALTFLITFSFLFIKLIKNIQKIKPKRIFLLIRLIHLTFISFLFFLIADIILILPYGANHTNYNFFLILIILSFYLINLIIHKSLNLNLTRNKIFLTASLGIVYACAAFHKLNYDFLNPEKSCANWYHIKLLKRFYFDLDTAELPLLIKSISPLLTLIIEFMAPIFLVFSKTRFLGIIFAVFLHSYLALGGFSDFSSLAFSILILYFPINLTTQNSWIYKITFYLFSSYLIIIICLFGAFIYPERKETLQSTQGIVLLFSFYYLLSFHKLTDFNFKTVFKFKIYDFIPTLIILFLFIFGTSVYLGYRSGGVFTMFSNLTLAGGRNNHLILKNLNIFDYETDIYQIQFSASEKIFAETRRSNDWITKSGLYLAYLKSLKENRQFKLKIKDNNDRLIDLNKNNAFAFFKKEQSLFFKKTYMYSLIPDENDKLSCRW